MLFTPPTLALVAVRKPAASVALAQASELGSFSTGRMEFLGTGTHASAQTDVRTAPGWLSVRHLVFFLARRTKFLGTELYALFESMVRTAPGWLSVRPSQIFSQQWNQGLGTAGDSTGLTDVRTAPGWLSARRPVVFIAGRLKHFGTLLQSRSEGVARAVLCVFPQRATSIFFFRQNHALGTAQGIASLTDACAAPGWLSAQAPVDFNEAAPQSDYHLPVFPREIARWMEAGEGKFIIDGTLGGGGHSQIFLNAGAKVLGIDRDPEALAHARARLATFGTRFSTWEGNFSLMRNSPEIRKGEQADGLLLDLGVSSRQLDSAARGFSFMREGPLDMRMGPSSPHTAAEIVNHWPESEIVRILFEFGEESKARRIAGGIVRQRAEKPFVTTLDLANCVERAIGRQGRTHPATRTFQAIRMAVNEELESLAKALTDVSKSLKPGGRLLIITFHSLEDRVVKRFLRHHSAPFLDDPGWPEPRPNPDCQFRLLARKAIIPGAEEISLNPRARSAKLRVAQLLDPKS